jgi:toxin ParE1/3/4
MKRVVLDPAARAELDAAASFYEDDYPGRGLRFYDAVEEAIAAVAFSPRAAPRVAGTPDELGLRQRSLSRFPYLIIYRDLGPVLRVVAIAHGKRPPGYWLGRLLRRST